MVYFQVASLLQVHGWIQQENVIVYINLSCTHNFINVNLEKKLQVSAKHIQSAQVDGKNVQLFKDLKLTIFIQINIDEIMLAARVNGNNNLLLLNTSMNL